jgi:hypothetical protein
MTDPPASITFLVKPTIAFSTVFPFDVWCHGSDAIDVAEAVATGYQGARQGTSSRGLASAKPIRRCEINGSKMTEPEKEDPLSRANELESIVDELDEKVASEREAEGFPGKPSDRENAPTRVTENEPPD